MEDSDDEGLSSDDDPEWEDLMNMELEGDEDVDSVVLTDDECATNLPDIMVECFTRSGRQVKAPKRYD